MTAQRPGRLLAATLALLSLVGQGSPLSTALADTRTALSAASAPKLDFMVDLTWASVYMTDGFKVAGDNPVMQPSVTVGLPATGLSGTVWSSLELNRGVQQYDELDFMAKYGRDLFAGTAHAINLHGFLDYWLYPRMDVYPDINDDTNPQSKHGNKAHAGVSLTELIPLWGSHIVPSYNVYYWFFWAQNRRDQYLGGAHHELMLSYSNFIPRFLPGTTAQFASVAGTINFNDGAFGVQPGWSHSTINLATGAYALGLIFTVSVNRQWSYLASVDPGNELWTTLSITKRL